LTPKIGRKITNALEVCGYQEVTIVIDGNGDQEATRERVLQQIPERFIEKTSLIVIETEIEEWLTHSLDIKLRGRKPSEALKDHLANDGKKYKKNMLPELASQIDFTKLEHVESFRQFKERFV